MTRRDLVLILLAGVVCVACNLVSTYTERTPTAVFPTETPIPPLAVTTEITTPTMPAEARGAVNFAKQDLADRLGIPFDKVEVFDVKAVEWPDSGLDCAAPGSHVLGKTTPGYRVTLIGEDKRYEYHSGGVTTCKLCQPGLYDAAQVIEVVPGEVITLTGEIVSIGHVPFTRLALSTLNGETIEIAESPVAREMAALPRQKLEVKGRVLGRGLYVPIQIEALHYRQP